MRQAAAAKPLPHHETFSQRSAALGLRDAVAQRAATRVAKPGGGIAGSSSTAGRPGRASATRRDMSALMASSGSLPSTAAKLPGKAPTSQREGLFHS